VAEPPRLAVVPGIAGLSGDLGRLLVAVGVFDGLHRGHAYLLRRLVAEARRHDARPAVLTFDAHPDAVVRGEAPPLLLDPDERLVRLAAAGVAVVVVVHFDDALRHTPYDEFVASIRERVDLAGFVMTPDAAFGYERRGTPEALARLGAASTSWFDVVIVPPFLLEGRPVRSSDIRAAVADGRLDDARHLLGRRHAVSGVVDASGILAPPMPVALPPAGPYDARLGAAWSLDTARPSGARPGLVEVDGDGRVAVRWGRFRERSSPPDGASSPRLRVAFARRST
jgi:hypothetical protein